MIITLPLPQKNGSAAVSRFPGANARAILIFLLLVIVLCSRPARSEDDSGTGTAVVNSCAVKPIIVPTLPENIPGYTELDPDTRLHVTGNPQVIDLASYSLAITGKVAHPLELKYDDLRCIAKIEARPALVCPGFFEDIATWAGASLRHVLELAGIQSHAHHIRLVSADGYATLVPIDQALSDKNFLAYEWEGQPIPVLHGFPVRAVFPELKGNKWVKWLVRIEVQ